MHPAIVERVHGATDVPGAVYNIAVINPHGADSGVREVLIDGVVQRAEDGRPVNLLPVLAAGSEHEIQIVLGGGA